MTEEGQIVAEEAAAPQSDRTLRTSSARPQGVDIIFKNLIYSVEVEDKTVDSSLPCTKAYTTKELLKNVSGVFRAGEVAAIMGSSGAGKTTLLNVLACRVPKSNLTGEVYANSLAYTSEDFGDFANYVMQADYLFQTLTVRETLKFAADLKMDASEEVKLEMVEKLSKSFKLDGCLDTLVGGPNLKGISGGEKRRTSIAFELVSDPQVMMLDEPTSGLDSLTSYVIIRYLKKLAVQQNKTMIMTIHQPNSQIFALFDNLVLMVEGRLVYQGKSTEALGYFQNHFSLNAPKLSNPADYLMSMLHQEKKSNVQRYPHYFQSYEDSIAPRVLESMGHRPNHQIARREVAVPFWVTFKTLFQRDVTNAFRNPMILLSRLFQYIFISLFTSGVYYRFSGEYIELSNWRALTGFLFFLSIGGVMMEVTPVSLVFPLERPVFLKEEAAKLYGTWPYFLSRSCVQLPYLLVFPMILLLISYWFVNLSSTATQFFTMYFVVFLLNFAGNSLGLWVGSMVQDAKTVSSVTTILILPLIIFAGFFKNRANLPDWIFWIEYISPFKYGFAAMLQNEVRYASESRVDEFNFEFGIWPNIALLAVLGLVFRALSLTFLYLLRTKLE